MTAVALMAERWAGLKVQLQDMASSSLSRLPSREGRLVRMVGLRLEVEGCTGAVGSRCKILGTEGHSIEAEVVGFSDGRLILMPEGALTGIMLGARVQPLGFSQRVVVDDQLLGRVLDGAGHLIDGGPRLRCNQHVPLRGPSINPLQRGAIATPLDVGVRAINAFATIGKGQRLGLFAGSGVGKSTLLGMMTRHCAADVVVVSLVGERGREVREFVEDILGPEGLRRAVIIATPADDPPLLRVHGAWRATAIAEYFRQQGKDVLLLMDSLTRFAQAQREIGLAAGEPPVAKGYPPSVFSLLPALVERAGNTPEGSITAVYTVLVEGDDLADPIADATRAILDGHIVLSRELADSGLYPAFDPEASISRSMLNLVSTSQLMVARQVKQLYALYRQNRDLVAIGAYERGSDPQIDRALSVIPLLTAFIAQSAAQRIDLADSLQQLDELLRRAGGVAGDGV